MLRILICVLKWYFENEFRIINYILVVKQIHFWKLWVLLLESILFAGELKFLKINYTHHNPTLQSFSFPSPRALLVTTFDHWIQEWGMGWLEELHTFGNEGVDFSKSASDELPSLNGNVNWLRKRSPSERIISYRIVSRVERSSLSLTSTGLYCPSLNSSILSTRTWATRFTHILFTFGVGCCPIP